MGFFRVKMDWAQCTDWSRVACTFQYKQAKRSSLYTPFSCLLFVRMVLSVWQDSKLPRIGLRNISRLVYHHKEPVWSPSCFLQLQNAPSVVAYPRNCGRASHTCFPWEEGLGTKLKAAVATRCLCIWQEISWFLYEIQVQQKWMQVHKCCCAERLMCCCLFLS